MIKYACAFLLSFLGLSADAADYEFGIGGRPLICVPYSDVPEYNRPLTRSSLSFVPSSNPQELLTFQYNAPQILKTIPRFHLNRTYQYDDPPNALFGSVSLVSSSYKESSLGAAAGPKVDKIWRKAGVCTKPVISKVPGSSTYLAKCERDDFWHILFDRQPGSVRGARNVYDYVLAECTLTSIGFGIHKGAELEGCTRRIAYRDFRIDYEFQIQNSGVIPQMDSFLRSRIDTWKRRCSAH